MSDEQEPQLTVHHAGQASTRTTLGRTLRGAARDLERIADDAVAALGPTACEHDALAWVDEVYDIAMGLRYAAEEADEDEDEDEDDDEDDEEDKDGAS
jgi:hypothetical protein